MRFRAVGSFLLLQALFLASEAVGGPVLRDDATSEPLPPEFAAKLGLAAPASASQPLGVATTAVDVSRVETPPGKRPNAGTPADAKSSLVLTLDEAREATVKRARTNSVVTSSQTAATSSASGSSVDESDFEIDPDLKEAAKTALQRAREARQWLERALPGTEDGPFQEPTWAYGSRSERAGGEVGFGENTPSKADSGSEYPRTYQHAHPYERSAPGELNLIREGIKFIKDSLEHPFTWLLMPFLVFGILAMWIVQYRAGSETRQVGGRAARRRHGSSDPSRERRRAKSGRTAAMVVSPRHRKTHSPAKPEISGFLISR